MVEKDATSPAAGVFAKLVAALLGLAVPTAVGAGLWTKVTSHWVGSILLLVVYWLAMGLVALATGVGGALKAAWVPRLAGAVDSAVMAAVYRHRAHYLRQLGDSVRDVETLGLPTQATHILRLQEVYVDVSLAARPLQDTSAEPFVGRLSAPGQGKTLDAVLAANEHRAYAVIGGPGSGKTTLMRHTASELCQHAARRRPLPVLMYLRDHLAVILADSGMAAGGLGAVATEAGWLHGKIPAAWLARQLDRGGCLIMLDGLDEVAGEADRRKVVAWVNRQTERYPRNDFVITSRPAGYLSNPLGKADVLQVRRLTVEQISVFLHGWYYAINCRAMDDSGERVRARSTREADDLLARLRGEPALFDLAANPLLLTMIATVHRYRGALPGSRAALYGEMCQVLLHRRQEAKGLTDPDASLRGEQKEYVVRVLALRMVRDRLRDLPAKQVHQTVRSALAQVSSKVGPEQFLADVHRSGLLVERENGVYSFAHLTLQEYLAAAQIRELQRVDLLAESVDDPWWRETILLWAAGDDATPVVNACLRKGTVRSLALAFDCADQARGIDARVRQELEDLLKDTETTDPERQRLITAIKVSRALSETIWLGESAAMIARPVSKVIYSLFVRDQGKLGLHYPPEHVSADSSASDAPAVGMWMSDAARFVVWINSLFDDGTAFRLPTWAELSDPASCMVGELARHTAWTQQGSALNLYRSVGVPDPYQPTETVVQQARTSAHLQTPARVALLLAVMLPLALAAARRLSVDSSKAESFELATGVAHRLTGLLVRNPELVGDLQSVYDLDLDLRGGYIEGLAGDLIGRSIPDGLPHALVRSELVAVHLVTELLRGTLARGLEGKRGPDDLVEDLLRDVQDPDGAGPVALRTQLAAYYLTLLRWTPASRKYKDGQLLENFETLQTSAAMPSAQITPTSSQDLRSLLDQAEQSLLTQLSVLQHGRPKAMLELILGIVQRVRELVEPVLERAKPYDPVGLAAARTGLAAAILAAVDLGIADIGDLLARALNALVALYARDIGQPAPNEVLLLVRA